MIIMNLLRVVFIAVSLALTLPVVAQESNDSNMEILRDKVKADKKLVVAGNMQLTDAEAKKFWPVYDAYQADLKKVNMQLGDVINTYADAYANNAVTNDVAKKLVNDALAVEEAELKLKRTYLPKVDAAVGAVKAARYMQIENKIRALIKFELAGGIPLVK